VTQVNANLAKPALAALRGRSRSKRAFSSDLSVDDAVLLAEHGHEPLGLVNGSSIFHIGYGQYWVGNRSGELTQLSSAMYEARHKAMGRMLDRASRLGAMGIVAVKLQVRAFEPRSGLAAFHVAGTAIGAPSSPAGSGHIGGAHQRRGGQPFTSDLSARDYYLLHRAGYEPLGMVMGSCVYAVASQGFGNWTGSRAYGEMQAATGALYDARELAMGRMQEEARRLGAQGIVGVAVTERSHGWTSHVIEFFAIGTAVRLTAGEHRLVDPKVVVPLEDPAVMTDPGAVMGGGNQEG